MEELRKRIWECLTTTKIDEFKFLASIVKIDDLDDLKKHLFDGTKKEEGLDFAVSQAIVRLMAWHIVKLQDPAKEIEAVLNKWQRNDSTLDSKIIESGEKIIISSASSWFDVVSGNVVLATSKEEIKRKQSDLYGKILIIDYIDQMTLFSLREVIKGIILRDGTSNSHLALFAREANIPCVLGIGNAKKCFENGDSVQVNGKTGKIIIFKASK